MWRLPDDLEVVIGGNFFVRTPVILGYCGSPIISLAPVGSGGELSLGLVLCGAGGERLARVVDWRLLGPGAEKFETARDDRRFMVISRITGRMVFELRRGRGPNEVALTADLFLPDGGRFTATPGQLGGEWPRMKDCVFVGAAAAFMVGGGDAVFSLDAPDIH